MTENEAIKEIRHESRNEKGVSKRCHDRCMYRKEKCAYSMAIEALEEVMKYRELGTIEELKDLKDGKLSGRELAMIAVDVNKLKKYQEIGTIEECREAMEKQMGKKPNKRTDKYTDLIQHYSCPVCGKYFGQAGVHNVILFEKPKYCTCGQAISWDNDAP